MYYNHGTAEKIPSEEWRRQEGEGLRFDLKINICIVVHALLCKVLPDNCTCVNTLNEDFVFKKKKEEEERWIWINAMTIVHLKSVCIIY